MESSTNHPVRCATHIAKTRKRAHLRKEPWFAVFLWSMQEWITSVVLYNSNIASRLRETTLLYFIFYCVSIQTHLACDKPLHVTCLHPYTYLVRYGFTVNHFHSQWTGFQLSPSYHFRLIDRLIQTSLRPRQCSCCRMHPQCSD